MVSSYTVNKSLEKPANGSYVDTWNVPVNADMDAIDQSLGGVTYLNATGGSATLTVDQYRSMILLVSGGMSGNVIYTIPTGVGGSWIVYNTTTDATGGPWTVTFRSGGGGTTIVTRRGYNTTIYSDGSNIRLADNASIPGGLNTYVQFNQNDAFGGNSGFVYDYTNTRVGIGTSSPGTKLDVVGSDPIIRAREGSNAFEFKWENSTGLAALNASGSSSFPIVFRQNNTERARIDASGNFLVGTATALFSASNRASITINGTSTSVLTLSNGASTSTSAYLYWDGTNLTTSNNNTAGILNWTTNGGERMRIDNVGNVGIANTDPSQLLSLGSASAGTGLGFGTSTANYTNIFSSYSAASLVLGAGIQGGRSSDIYTSSYGGGSVYRNAIRLDSVSANGIQFLTAGTSTVARGTAVTVNERMRITPDGLVGINVTNPTARLQVNGTIYSTSGGYIFPDGTTQTTAAGVISLTSGAGINLSASTGNITISVGNNSITNTQLAAGAAAANLGFTPLPNTGGTLTGDLTISKSAPAILMTDTGWGNRYLYAAGGDIGFLTSAGNWAFRCDNSGNVTATGNVTAYSDIALKTDLVQIGDALDIVKQLHGYRYTRTDLEQKEIGVVAQEVEKLLPEIVFQNGEYKSVAYDRLVAVLIEAVKTLNARIESLEAR